jgi:hypothetical protein
MGYVPLWVLSIENLAVSLLLMATVFALVGRFRWRWMGFLIWIPLVIFIFLGYLGITINAAFFKFNYLHDSVLFYHALALTIGYLIGVIWLCIAGVRRKKNNPAVPAATWSLGKLILTFIIALGLHSMTIWILDYQGREKQALLRTEASVLGLSVAPPRVPDRDNAAFLYEQAGSILDSAISKMPKEPAENVDEGEIAWYKWHDSIDKEKFDPKDLKLVQFLQQQAGTIALILEATNKPDCYFEHDYLKPSVAELMPEGLLSSHIAGLLAFDARWKAATGNLRAAMEDINAMFVLANRLSDESFEIQTVIAFSIERSAIKTLQDILATHQLKQEELDIVKFDRFLSYQIIMQRALRFEEAAELNLLSEIGEIWDYPSLKSLPKKEIQLNPYIFRIFFLNYEAQYLKWYSTSLDHLASQPYYQSKDSWQKLIKRIDDDPRSMIVAIYLPGLNIYVQIMVRANAQHSVADIALAMCRYHVKNGKYPEKLDELAPGFIAFVPLDPFDGKPMRLKQTEKEMIIYSIGPDGIDDGGTPLDQETRKGDITFELPNK